MHAHPGSLRLRFALLKKCPARLDGVCDSCAASAACNMWKRAPPPAPS
ncbi:hypothetical protein LP420_35585 [Massilia sp. B-10]|nr:hypothetical protein LP420_35585 [Massilia sp. B-10]UUZ53774.1 hypothetical protein LP419_35040 [Massilia sp. H-1]